MSAYASVGKVRMAAGVQGRPAEGKVSRALARRNLLVTEVLVILALMLRLVSEPVESKSGNSA